MYTCFLVLRVQNVNLVDEKVYSRSQFFHIFFFSIFDHHDKFPYYMFVAPNLEEWEKLGYHQLPLRLVLTGVHFNIVHVLKVNSQPNQELFLIHLGYYSL